MTAFNRQYNIQGANMIWSADHAMIDHVLEVVVMNLFSSAVLNTLQLIGSKQCFNLCRQYEQLFLSSYNWIRWMINVLGAPILGLTTYWMNSFNICYAMSRGLSATIFLLLKLWQIQINMSPLDDLSNERKRGWRNLFLLLENSYQGGASKSSPPDSDMCCVLLPLTNVRKQDQGSGNL